MYLDFSALVRCLGREISFSVLNNFLLRTNNCLFSTNFIESEFLQSCFIACFCHFCMISHSSALMKNKGRVHKFSYVDLTLFKLQNPIENSDFCTVNLELCNIPGLLGRNVNFPKGQKIFMVYVAAPCCCCLFLGFSKTIFGPIV